MPSGRILPPLERVSRCGLELEWHGRSSTAAPAAPLARLRVSSAVSRAGLPLTRFESSGPTVFFRASSAWFQAKSMQTTLRHNLFFSGPRAGINFNDGFGGGNVIDSNLLFNFCRESSDVKDRDACSSPT